MTQTLDASSPESSSDFDPLEWHHHPSPSLFGPCEACEQEAYPKDNLCLACQGLRFRHLLQCDRSWNHISLGTLRGLQKRKDCSFCQLVIQGISQEWETASVAGDMEEVNPTCYLWHTLRWKSEVPQFGLYIQLRNERDFEESGIILDFTLAVWMPDKIQSSKQCAFLRTEMISVAYLDLCKDWIRSCEMGHEQCRSQHTMTTLPSEFRLIDVQRMCVMRVSESCRYLTLSYVWGRVEETRLVLSLANVTLLEKERALLHAEVPNVIIDAIHLCTKLGERYLWVDSLCIIQDSWEHKQMQILAMDKIYSSSMLTIVAAAGDSANCHLPGVWHEKRPAFQDTVSMEGMQILQVLPDLLESVGKSVWNTRAWTFQEHMLSRRCLVITSAQAYYQCQGQEEAEDGCLRKSSNNLHGQYLFDHHPRSLHWFWMYRNMVARYTARSLSYSSDILNAFQGISNALSGENSESFIFGLSETHFDLALLWQPKGSLKHRVCEDMVLPSWSWVALNGPVAFPEVYRFETLVNWSTCLQDGHITAIKASQWWFKNHPLSCSKPEEKGRLPCLVDDVSFKTSEFLACQRAGRLIFRAQSAMFFLQDQGADRSATSNRDGTDIVSLRILDNPGDFAGTISVDKSWVDVKLESSSEGMKQPQVQMYEFVALSLARLLMQSEDRLENDWAEDKTVVNVMLLGWSKNVAHRVGIGLVLWDKWKNARPTLKTVVLE